MSHACKTPGAIYSINIYSNKVECKVELPRGVRVSRDQRTIKQAVHDAMEHALAELFR